MNSHPVTSIDHTISFGAYASQDKSVKPDECQARSFTNSHSWAIDEVDKRCSRRTILSHARHRRGVGRVWKDVRSPPLGVNKKIISCFFFFSRSGLTLQCAGTGCFVSRSRALLSLFSITHPARLMVNGAPKTQTAPTKPIQGQGGQGW